MHKPSVTFANRAIDYMLTQSSNVFVEQQQMQALLNVIRYLMLILNVESCVHRALEKGGVCIA